MDKKTTIETLLRQGQGIRAICRVVKSSPKVVIRLQRAMERETLHSEVPTGPDLQRETVSAQVPTGSLDDSFVDSWGFEEQREESSGASGQELATRSIQLRPYLDVVQALMERGLEARLIWRELVESHGFSGAEDSVKRLVRRARARSPKWFQMLPVLPGQEAQMDFVEGPKVWKGEGRTEKDKKRTWIMVLTLSHSGMSYREVIANQSAQTVLEALMRGFEKFGGVPEWLKIDNFKAAVTQAHRFDPVLSPLFQAWASHYGIVLSPCDPGKPNQKGRVERDCRYTRESFFKSVPETVTMEVLNQKLQEWSRSVANQRMHGRHKRQVQEVFQTEEKPALRPLPERAFLIFELGMRKVSVHGAVEIDGCHYEVSHRLIGTAVEVRYDSREIRVYGNSEGHESKLLVRHVRCWKKGTLVGAAGAHPTWMDRPRVDREVYFIRAASEQVGPHCEALVRAVLSNDRGRHPRTHRTVQGIRNLARKFGATVLEQACSRTTPNPEVSWHRLQELCEMIRAKQDVNNCREDVGDVIPTASRTLPRHSDPVIRTLTEYDDLIEGMASMSEVVG